MRYILIPVVFVFLYSNRIYCNQNLYNVDSCRFDNITLKDVYIHKLKEFCTEKNKLQLDEDNDMYREKFDDEFENFISYYRRDVNVTERDRMLSGLQLLHQINTTSVKLGVSDTTAINLGKTIINILKNVDNNTETNVDNTSKESEPTQDFNSLDWDKMIIATLFAALLVLAYLHGLIKRKKGKIEIEKSNLKLEIKDLRSKRKIPDEAKDLKIEQDKLENQKKEFKQLKLEKNNLQLEKGKLENRIAHLVEENNRLKKQEDLDNKSDEIEQERENRKEVVSKKQVDSPYPKSHSPQTNIVEEKSPSSFTQQLQPSRTHNSPKYETYYLSTPNEDGSFKEKSKSSQQTFSSYYKMIKISDTVAEFTIIDDKDLQKKAIYSYDRVIAPVCENANNFDSTKTGIRQEESGKLELRGDVWKVTKKCKVRYI